MTTGQKRTTLAEACGKTPINVCNDDRYIDTCPMCGVCVDFSAVSDVSIIQLYGEAVRRGTIKEEK
jgi:hypothetical protein